MPQYKYGDMFAAFDAQEGPKHLFATCNCIVKQDGCLVMGGGAARQLLDRCPGIDREFAQKMVDILSVSSLPADLKMFGHSCYGVMLSHKYPEYGAFQTKYDWKDKSDLSLIAYGCNLLANAKNHPETTIYLNYPGIGLGGLTETEVAPLLEVLPDNVLVWRNKQ